MDAKKELDAVAQRVSVLAATRARQALRRIDEPTATERALGITREAIVVKRIARKFTAAIRAMADVSRTANEAAQRLAAAIAETTGNSASSRITAAEKGAE